MRQDYVNVRFLEWWSYHPRQLSADIFPGWMKYECKINDPLQKTKEMMQEGFLCECTLEESLSRLSVAELKSIAESQNLPKGKKKQEIIDIILEHGNKDLIDVPVFITITEKGRAYISAPTPTTSTKDFFVKDYIIKDESGNIIGVNINKYAADFDKNTGSFNMISRNSINEIINLNIRDLKILPFEVELTDELFNDIKEALICGELRGCGEIEISAPVVKKYNIETKKACLIIRTFENFCKTKRDLKEFRKTGIEEYEYAALIDEQTSDICKTLNKKRFKVKDAVIGVNCPPMHVGCRSSILPVMKTENELDDEFEKMMREERAPAGMNFEEFVEHLIPSDDGERLVFDSHNKYDDKFSKI